MPRIRHTGGPARFNHRSFSGISGYGDEHDVSAEAADYLCDGLGHFERTGEITLEPDEYEVHNDSDADLADRTYDELMNLAQERDVDGRSTMDKAELIDALQED